MASNPNQCSIEKITDADLGSMYLLFDQALVTRSSSSILFFKIDEETKLWKQYHKFENMRGQIYFIRGNIRIQVVTDEKIYFYMIDKVTEKRKQSKKERKETMMKSSLVDSDVEVITFMPNLENVMYNFMNCSQLMFGTRVRYGISYKANQPGFQIFTRKYYHNFKVAITNENFEGAKGANLSSMNAYIMAETTKIGIYDDKNF